VYKKKPRTQKRKEELSQSIGIRQNELELDDEEKDTSYHEDLPEYSLQGLHRLNIELWTNFVLNFASSEIYGLRHRLLRLVDDSTMKQSYNRDDVLQQRMINKRIARVHFLVEIPAPKSSALLPLVFDRLSHDRHLASAKHFETSSFEKRAGDDIEG